VLDVGLAHPLETDGLDQPSYPFEARPHVHGSASSSASTRASRKTKDHVTSRYIFFAIIFQGGPGGGFHLSGGSVPHGPRRTRRVLLTTRFSRRAARRLTYG
jgi:hypothetical protein